jgi:hypothetical protein
MRLDPWLLGGDPCRIELELLNVALDPLVADPLAVLETAFAYLPSAAAVLRERRDQTIYRFELHSAQRSARSGDLLGSLRHVLLAIALRPEHLVRWQTWTAGASWIGRSCRAALLRTRVPA